jgi:hypothetical protein
VTCFARGVLRLTASVAALAAVLAACSSSPSSSASASGASATDPPKDANPGESPASKDKPKDSTTQLVLGLDAEDFGSEGYALDAVDVVAKVDGVVAAQETLDREGGPMFPHELHLVAPQAHPDAPVEIAITARMSDAVVVARTVTTRFVPGKTKLAYVRLEVRCNTFPLLGGGGPSGPTCQNPGETCVGGTCRSDALGDLPDFAPTWASDPPSACGAGAAAELSVGQGETAFAPMPDGTTAVVECGPQGGHHIWLSLGMKNLSQFKTTTTVSATQPGSSVAVPATAYPYAWSPAADGSCGLVGVRFQLDVGAAKIADFLGKPLDVQVTAKDKAGHEATVVRHLQLPDTVTGPFCR